MSNHKEEFITPNYARFPVSLVRGEGSVVFDEDGKRYVDLLAGISVCSLGHCHPGLVSALTEQAEKLWHVSNLYKIQGQYDLAEKISEASFPSRVFFCNSGTEANEAALKIARLAATEIGGKPRGVFVAMKNSFHGRSTGSLSVTGTEAYRRPFEPLMPEVRFADFNDLESLDRVMDDRVAAVILEPLQAEGGLNCPKPGFLEGVRKACNQHGALMILDEVQTGMSRLGTTFAFHRYGVVPDVFTLAKGLGGGFPVGAMVAKSEIADLLIPGTHASTFGGNPLAMAVANKAFDLLTTPEFHVGVNHRAKQLDEALKSFESHADVLELRGAGMLRGFKMKSADRASAFLTTAMKDGVLIGKAGADVIRIAPPLNIPAELLEDALTVLEKALN